MLISIPQAISIAEGFFQAIRSSPLLTVALEQLAEAVTRIGRPLFLRARSGRAQPRQLGAVPPERSTRFGDGKGEMERA